MNSPSVTVGVPVYNEEQFIDSALTSLRGQDYPNLEIVIADNASTDKTLAICERHAAEDRRVRIEGSQTNVGAAANFRRAADFATGEYFMWGTGHDLWSPDVVSKCVELLEDHRDATVAFPSSSFIGPDDEVLGREVGWSDMRGLDPIARFFTVFWGSMHPVMGVIRTASLRECAPFRNIVGGDLVLLSDLVLRGPFLHAPEARWFRREFRTERTFKDKVRRYSSSEVGLSATRRGRAFPLFDLPSALVAVVWRSELPWRDKMALTVALVPSLPLRYMVGQRWRAS